MKYIAQILTLGVILSYGDVTPQNMFPVTPINTFETRPPESIHNSTTTRTTVQRANNAVQVNDIPEIEINSTSTTGFGRTEISKDVNWTNPLSIEALFKDTTKENLNKANNFAEDFRKKAQEKFTDKNGAAIDNQNPETFNEDAIVKNFDEATQARSALAFKNELYNDLRAKLVVDGQIKCYITRKVNNSYFCPLPSLGAAEFGGLAKDNQEEAQKQCNEECQQQVQCLEMKIGDSSNFNASEELTLPIQWKTFSTNPEQITQEFSFEYVTKNLSEIQDKYFEDGLVRGRITLKGIDPYNNEVTIFDGYTYHIKKEGGRVTLRVDKQLKELKAYFFSSFIFDPKYMSEVALYGENPEVTIKNMSGVYQSNTRYFCPITQIEADATRCDGEIKFINFGSTSQSVCVPRRDILSSNRSFIDGGYYRKNTCLSACVDKAECVPTYRHLSLDTENLPPNTFDIEYGCVADDGGNNKGCTKERCRALFEKDTQPSTEVVWEKDDNRVTTVDSGVDVADKHRPRVDFQGELGAVGNADKTALFSEEMKDTAYQNMIQDESFNVSKETLAASLPAKFAVDVRVNSASNQISFNLLYKAPSNTYDENKQLYLYPVIEVFSTYTPYKPINYNGTTYYPENDPKMKAKDSVLLIQNQSTKQWTPFNRKMWQQYYLPSRANSGQIIYKWVDTTSSVRQYTDVFFPNTCTFVAYGPGYKAGGSFMDLILTPKSDKPWEEYLLFPSLSNVLNKEGLFHTTNHANTGKTYRFADLNEDRKAYYDGYKVYLIASEGTPLDLKSVGERVNENTLVYDSKKVNGARTEIEPDSLYADDRVKLYIQGKANKQSVFMKIKPNSTELEHKGVIFMFLHQ
jgi:hypothetical protein